MPTSLLEVDYIEAAVSKHEKCAVSVLAQVPVRSDANLQRFTQYSFAYSLDDKAVILYPKPLSLDPNP